MRTGIGYDIHKFIDGRKLMLGGVEIPSTKGLDGHSDADVLLHAICDAILGAAAQGDIGQHFPETDAAFKDVDSLQLLKESAKLASKKGFSVNNVDAVLVIEEPRVEPFKDRMRIMIARTLNIANSAVNVKATTNEGMGAIGAGDAIAAHAVVTLKESKK